MDDEMRSHTVESICKTLKTVPRDIQERAAKNFYKADPEYGDRIAQTCGFPSVKSRL